MSKKRERNRLKKAIRTERAKIAEDKKGIRNSLLKVGAFIIGFIGVLSSLVTFLPRLSLSQFPEANPDSPLSLKFQIANESIVPLRKVEYRCWMPFVFSRKPDITTPPVEAVNDSIESRRFFDVGNLNPDEKVTISTFGFTKLAPNEDISVVLEFEISYRPIFMPWRVHKRVRMVSIVDREGNTTWVQHPLGDLDYLQRGRHRIYQIPIPLSALEKSRSAGSKEVVYSLESGRIEHKETNPKKGSN
ncbi:MAG TPA: hypothetical protein VGH19_03105 [Verrucomicrobiae bacterium]